MVGPEGHRKRLRSFYETGKYDNIADHNLLEIFLTCVIPRRDVKQLSYDLINTFGSLEGVCSAPPDELRSVKGVGEKTALALSLVGTINDRIIDNSHKVSKKLTSLNDVKEYSKLMLLSESVEKMILVRCANDGEVLATVVLAEGTANAIDIGMDVIVKNALIGNGASFFIAHNHPNGSCIASQNDVDFTVALKAVFDKMHTDFIDHIIVSPEGCTAILNESLPSGNICL